MSAPRNEIRIERLKSKDAIDRLFNQGEVEQKKNLLLRYIKETDGSTLYVGVSVSKRRFKRAVDRNKIKRLLRVAIKTNEDKLSFSGYFILIYTGKRIPHTGNLIEQVKEVFDSL